LPARRTCASVSIVRLADSAIGLGQLAVIATPSRTRQPRTSLAALPAFRRLRSALFALSLVCSLAGVWLRLDRRSGEYVISAQQFGGDPGVVDYFGRRAGSAKRSPERLCLGPDGCSTRRPRI
jgi:hypothetical protein